MKSDTRKAVVMTLAVALLSTPAVQAGVDRGECDPPQVLIVLDKSSSMVTGDDSNGVTKWESATAAVETLVTSYGDRIDFGLMVFPYLHECSPGSVVVDVGAGTAPSIVSFLRNAPPDSGNHTPMSQSLDVAAGYAPLLDPDRRSFVLLVTDGWQYCVPYDAATRFDAVDSVETLYGLGIDTFVLGFGDSVDVLNNNYMAEAGGQALPGCNPAGDDPHAADLCYHQTGNQAELEAAFDDIALVVTEEICDGKDNDCDGYTDNLVPGSPDPLKKTVTGVCGSCESVCLDAQWQPCTAEGPCDDGNACTTNDWCADDVCQGEPITCDDGNFCTDDACDPARGCVYTNNKNPCDDGDPCTLEDICTQGACQGQLIDCDDGDPCTDDFCDPQAGCRSECNNAPCDDGDPCTEGDTCRSCTCVSGRDVCGENPCDGVDCDDGNPCTDDSCDPDTGECVHQNNHNACDDDDDCTYNDQCSGGVCTGTPIDCDDGNPCTQDFCVEGPCEGDACDPNGCVHRPQDGPCDDGDPCTEGESCQGGMCTGGTDMCGADETDPGGGASGCGCAAGAPDDASGTAGLLPALLLGLAARRRGW